MIIPAPHVCARCNIVTSTLHDKVKAILEFFAQGRGFMIDPNGQPVSSTSNNSAHFSHYPSHTRNFHARANHYDRIRSTLQVCAHYCPNGFLVRVVLVIQYYPWPKPSNSMAALSSVIGAHFICFDAGGARRRQGPLEQCSLEIGQVIAL